MASPGTVFDMLKHRDEIDWGMIGWIVGVLIVLPLVLYIGNKVWLWQHNRRNQDRAFRALERLGTGKGLVYEDQVKLAEMAALAKLKNPALLLDSVNVFDRAVAVWMKRVMQRPWLDMETEVAWLKKMRKLVGFRYLSEAVEPSSTRELPFGSHVHAVIKDEDKLHLLTASVLGVDDLAVYITPFRKEDHEIVRVRLRHDLWCMFWSVGGEEYRFESQILKVVPAKEPVLLLEHGDRLLHERDHSVLVCEADMNIEIGWASAVRVDVMPVDVNVFEDVEKILTLPANINAWSSVWFRLDFIEGIQVEDLIQIHAMGDAPPFLAGMVGQVMRVGGRGISCTLIDVSEKQREGLVQELVRGISAETFMERVRKVD